MEATMITFAEMTEAQALDVMTRGADLPEVSPICAADLTPIWGVYLTSEPLDRENVALKIDIPEELFVKHEWVLGPPQHCYRESCVPAELLRPYRPTVYRHLLFSGHSRRELLQLVASGWQVEAARNAIAFFDAVGWMRVEANRGE
jgi:hypothetical protein